MGDKQRQFLFCGRGFRSAILVFVTSAASGCGGLYLHNDERQATAREAQSSFEEVVASGAVEGLIELYKSHAGLAEDVVGSATESRATVDLASLPNLTWNMLTSQTQDLLNSVLSAKPDARTALEEAKRQLRDALKEKKVAAEDVQSAAEALNQAALAKARYEATQMLLGQTMTIFVSAVKEEAPEKLKDILSETIDVQTYKTKGSGGLAEGVSEPKTVSDLLGLEELTALLSDEGLALGEDPEAILAKLKGVGELSDVAEKLSFEEPGITITIMGLAYDLARAREINIASVTANLRQLVDLRERQLDFLDDYEIVLQADLNNDGIGIAAARQLAASESEVVRSTLERLASQWRAAADQNGRDRARGALILALAALAINYENRVTKKQILDGFEDEVALLIADDAIAAAEGRLRERQAVIQRGFEGLVAFHDGGIASDDIRTIVGLAQTAGVFLIAAGE